MRNIVLALVVCATLLPATGADALTYRIGNNNFGPANAVICLGPQALQAVASIPASNPFLHDQDGNDFWIRAAKSNQILLFAVSKQTCKPRYAGVCQPNPLAPTPQHALLCPGKH